MGYNDDSGLSADEAVKRMRKQDWFAALSKDVTAVERVIFIVQPGYRQVAGAARKRKKSASSFTWGQLIEGSTWTTEAAKLVRGELGIETTVFDAPAEEIYAGFTRDEAGALWQDKAKCRSYTDHGIEYSEDGTPALWCDAQHPSASGAEAQQRCFPGPCPPQAVVECNFWQLRGSSSASIGNAAIHDADSNASAWSGTRPGINVSSEPHHPSNSQRGLLGEELGSYMVSPEVAAWKDLDIDDGLCLAEPWPQCSDDDDVLDRLDDLDDDNLPPWPHEM